MLNHEPLRLADGEYRFACLVWDNEPLPSGQLVTLAAAALMTPAMVVSNATFMDSDSVTVSPSRTAACLLRLSLIHI